MERIHEREGRDLFGSDPQAYDGVRPPYPRAAFATLVSEGALYAGAATLEIGAGSGTATRSLVEAGAAPLTLIEPDRRFHATLQRVASSDARIIAHPLEEADLRGERFDLVVAATAYHWLAPETRVRRLAELLRPAGHLALLWNLFQDRNLPDDFHDATKPVLEALAVSPSGAPDVLPFALDRAARESELLSSGWFRLRFYLEAHWSLELTPGQVRALYGTFSSIARLPAPERTRLLDRLGRIAEVEFGGRVVRNMTTPLYLFERTELRSVDP